MAPMLPRAIETFRLGPFITPRIWTGLWQLSSNAWGSASVSKIRQGMTRHVELGYTAFGELFAPPHTIAVLTAYRYEYSSLPAGVQADHYGSAEIIFVRWSLTHRLVIGANKHWHPRVNSAALSHLLTSRSWVRRNGAFSSALSLHEPLFWPRFKSAWSAWEALASIFSRRVGICLSLHSCVLIDHRRAMQFHWQDYSDQNYLTAMHILVDLKNEGLISAIGLCNFDAIRTDEICTQLGPGAVVSNQVQVRLLFAPRRTTYQIRRLNFVVQFSIIDTRPLHGMADVCEKHGLKLLTYGTLVSAPHAFDLLWSGCHGKHPFHSVAASSRTNG
ncbi:hypothetical protein H0H81_007359 [Sphagnurus paluster]|uniref:NADP-dependent oxidoreductase domain-containing protein n=1 Tax=Sphagnurus paluster TaxID=117069 RepID=A0A9P7GM32_9AGAR|nr:hypothetical protein H0H81_007359 [Sphagnurus paluster]